jgi:hypothetical protein
MPVFEVLIERTLTECAVVTVTAGTGADAADAALARVTSGAPPDYDCWEETAATYAVLEDEQCPYRAPANGACVGQAAARRYLQAGTPPSRRGVCPGSTTPPPAWTCT